MPFVSTCCCSQHSVWGHGSVGPKDLFAPSYMEEKMCGLGKWSTSGHKDRKRKICRFCRDRIALERKCEALETAEDAGPSTSQDDTRDFCPDPAEMVTGTSDNNTSFIEHGNDFRCEELQQTSQNKADKASQFPEMMQARQGYESVGDRRKRDLRSQIIEEMDRLLENYTFIGSKGTCSIMKDILASQKFICKFPGTLPVNTDVSKDDKILKSLAKDYLDSKDKEASKLVKAKARKISEKILIGGTFKGSNLQMNEAKSRTQAAKSLGRVHKSGDERRRLLSIVALDFPQSVLQSYFLCSKGTITAARVHCHLFGRGGSPQDGLRFSRQAVSPEIIHEFHEFIQQDNISRPSSCRSVLVDGTETAVRYWQYNVKDVIQQYQLKFPNGLKRTYIYTHLPKNFRTNSMLAGLCNLCDDFGHSNFDSLLALLDDLNCQGVLNRPLASLIQITREHQTYLKLKFAKELERHSNSSELCLDYALGQCPLQHTHCSSDIDKFHLLSKQVKEAVEKVRDPQKKAALTKSFEQIKANHREYLAHLIRTQHQGGYYRFVLENLCPGEVVVIIDYKMKVELGLRTRENQREWYGKRGISLHGFFVIAKVAANERKTQVIDLWSEDTKQDAWFTQSALDIGFQWLESMYPGFSVYLFSDNGPHYHNSGVLFYLTEVNRVFNITIKEYNNFEAGEGKSQLDSHFAHISHKIVRWVRMGNDLESGEQVAHLVKNMKNASCKKLLIDRSKSKKVGTLKDISLFGNFTFPVEGEFKDGLILRSLAAVGKTVSKTRAQISQLSGRQVPIAGATGAKTSEDQPAPEPIQCPSSFSSTNRESYAVRFIQHEPEQSSAASLDPLDVDHYLSQRPDTGYALKHGPGKRSIFSQAQKDIMIEFYNRQAVNRIRAEPKDVMRAMEQAGLEVLTANQIKSWWSTYHRKNKTLPASVPSVSDPPASALSGTVLPGLTVPPVSVPPGCTIPPSVTPGSTVSPACVLVASVPLTTVPPASVSPCSTTWPAAILPGLTLPTASVQPGSFSPGLTVPPASTLSGSTVPPGLNMLHVPTTIPGSISQFSNVIVEWSFPECFSQSTIMGRNGSNACAFICLYFGQVASKGVFSPRQGLLLPAQWRDSLEQSIIQGNDLHDELFDHEGVDLDAEDAVEMAGDDCGVVSLGQQKDLFGTSAKNLLAGWLNELSSRKKRSCHLFCASGKTMLLFIDSCGELYFVDSHSHKDSGALIASAPPGNGLSFADWIDKMMDFHWQTPLTLASVTEVIYMFI